MARRRCFSIALALAALAWCLMLAAPPLLEASGIRTPSLLIRALLDPVCHQMPERSFWLAGAPLAVCARCIGLYAGFLAGCVSLAAFALRGSRWPGPPPPRSVLLVMALPTFLELLAESTGLTQSSGPLRALAGWLFGLVVPCYLLPAIEGMASEMRLLDPFDRERTHAEAG